jgi:serine/threonine protein kinase
VNTLIVAESLKPLAAGCRLQEFVIERVLGMGGFGVVYLAQDTLLNRTVAIKEYMPNHMVSRIDGLTVTLKSESFAQDFETGKSSFINEARMLARFKHPALIEVFRFWEQNCTAYMATPFYDGCTLKEYLSNQPSVIDEAVLKGTLLPILDALQHMHQEKVYHRDISPDNIMILKDGRPILLDLGAARAVEIESAQALTVLVKPGYAPIEQYGGDSNRDQGPWTDIYGVGASAYFALVGKPPPPSASRVMRDSIIKLAQLKPAGYSFAFLNAMDVALAVRPDDRPQTVASLKAMFLTSPSEKTDLEATDKVVKVANFNEAAVRAKAVSLPSKTVTINSKSERPNAENKTPVGKIAVTALVVASIGISFWVVAPTNQSSKKSAAQVEVAKTTPIKADAIVVEPIVPSAPKVDEAKLPAPLVESTKTDSPVFAQPLAEPSKNGNAAASVGALPAEKPTEVAEKPTEVAEKPAIARLSIKPWGEIFVNNESKGVSPPLKALSLPAGSYAIEIRNSDYPAYKTNITLKAGENARINHAFVDSNKKTNGQ